MDSSLILISNKQSAITYDMKQYEISDICFTRGGYLLLYSSKKNELYLMRKNSGEIKHILTGRVKEMSYWHDTYVLLENYELYRFDQFSNENFERIPMSENIKIKHVVAGYSNSFIVDVNDDFYKMIDMVKLDDLHPLLTQYNTSNIIKITSGYDQVIVLTEHGYVFGCGYTGYGVTGNCDGSAKFDQPWTESTYFISQNIRMRDIASGMFHTLFFPMHENSYIYIVGHNGSGELGKFGGTIYTPSKLMIDAMTGLGNNYSTYIITFAGKLLYTGECVLGKQSSLHDVINTLTEVKIKDMKDAYNQNKLRVSSISPGDQLAVLLTSNLRLRIFTQLELHSRSSPFYDLEFVVE
jgi:hypothetical protein